MNRELRKFERLVQRGEMRRKDWALYGDALLDAHRYDDALSAFQRARARLRRGPRTEFEALVHGFEGQCHQKRGDLGRAIRSFRQSVRLDPQAPAWTFLGCALIRRDGWYAPAAKCFREALALEPDYEEAHYNLGCYYRFGKKLHLAEKHLRRAIEIDRRYATAYAELGHVIMNDAARLREARRFLRRAIALDPKHVWARIYLAIDSWRLDDLESADASYRAAVRLAPKWGLPRALHGDFLIATGRERRGREELRKALEIDDSREVRRWVEKHGGAGGPSERR